MNELATTNLIKVKQIKEVFSVYYIYYPKRNLKEIKYNKIFMKGKKKDKGKLSYYLTIQWNKFEVIYEDIYKEYDGKYGHNYDYTGWIKHHAGKEFSEFKNVVLRLTRYLNIPERYYPKETIITYGRNSIKGVQLIRIDFPEQLISYLSQKGKEELIKRDKYDRSLTTGIHIDRVVKLFKSLNEKDKGMGFDEYIKDWSKKLMGELNMETTQ